MKIDLIPLIDHPRGDDPSQKTIIWRSVPVQNAEAIQGGIFSVQGGYLVVWGDEAVEGVLPKFAHAQVILRQLFANALKETEDEHQ